MSGGGVILSVDFDALQEDLSVDACLSSYPKERYQFTWPGKREAKLEARRPINKTLKPCPEKSVNWDTTENIYIEGDNLEALKIMRETYMHKVKMIYIDPPYNTGHDFVYKDNFAKSKEEYLNEDGSYDEEGNRLEENLESNGRFHSDWCSMMYSRLLLARDFLTDDGVILISIDENEASNLDKICQEVFSSESLNRITWISNLKGRQIGRSGAAGCTESIYVYSRNNNLAPLFEGNVSDLTELMPSAYKGFNYREFSDCRGKFVVKNELYNSNSAFNEETRPNLVFDIFWNQSTGDVKTAKVDTVDSIDGYIKISPHKNSDGTHKYHAWRWSEKKILSESTELYFEINGSHARVYTKIRDYDKTLLKDIITDLATTKGLNDLTDIFDGEKVFDFPKPVQLVETLVKSVTEKDDVVLDFFSGSAVTAHAVINVNNQQHSSRKFILIQLPEETKLNSTARKNGYKTICEIGEERIRRVGNLIKEENNEVNKTPKLGEELKKVPDIGFRVFEVAESNIKDMSLSPDEIHQMNFEELNADNLKEGVTNLDLLYEVLPKLRIEYSADVETEIIWDKEVFVVNGNQLVACFDTDITNDAIQAIAEIQPLYAVFRDSSFADEAARTNLEEIFKAYSPDTQLRVI